MVRPPRGSAEEKFLEEERRKNERRKREVDSAEKKSGGEKDDKKQLKLPGFNWVRLLKAFIVAVIIGMTLFHPIAKPVKDFLLEIIGIGVPNIADYWDRIILVSGLIIIPAAAYVAWRRDSIDIGGIWIAAIIIVTVGYSFASPYLQSAGASGPLSSFKCLLQNLGNQEGMQMCAMETVSEPELQKIGSYDIIEVSFDTRYTGGEIYKSDSNYLDFDSLDFDRYFIDLVVENPSDTEPIKNFQIISEDTKLWRAGVIKTEEKIDLAYLVTTDGSCMDSACGDIEPKGTRIFTLKAVVIVCKGPQDEDTCELRDVCEWDEDAVECIDKEDRKTKEMEAKVKFSYDYAGQGDFDFIVGESDEVLAPKLASRADPQSSEGPVDVMVYFAPTAYVFRTDPTGDEFVRVMIKLSKDTGGTAIIKDPIRISRSSDGVLEKPEGCSSPWSAGDPNIPLVNMTEYDYSEKLEIGGDKSLSKSHAYVCKYGIDYSKLDINPDKDDVEVIPFTVIVDYSFEKTVTKKDIGVVKLTTAV